MATFRGLLLRMLVALPLVGGHLLVAQSNSAPLAQGDNSAVIAEVNGVKIKAAELEQKEKGMLLEAQSQYYQVQRKALDNLIDDHLLESEARREHITVSQLLEREVNAKVKAPSEDQIQVFYEGLESNEPYADVRGKIADRIRELRVRKARAAYLEKLRGQSNVIVELAPPKADVALQNAPIQGSRNAPVLVVEFADYECPYCQKVNPELKRLQQEFGSKIAVAFKDFPLPMHPDAPKAAEAARCAGRQGKFWEYHDVLFETKQIGAAALKQHARTLKLDTASFDKCLDSGQEAPAVQSDLAEAKSLGLTGTPSFFINGHFFSGADDHTLHDLIAEQLKVAQSPANASLRQ